ncbi:MAG: methylhydantoinase, partial [Rhodospirillales bacterium]|nr:methylhydantoinase [Rhodospirillales bacterium]
MTVRLAIDVGGTFTDVVLDHHGHKTTAKVLTTPSRPADGFMAGVKQVLADSSVAPEAVDLVLHGTTLATNALIERKGVKTALITTDGHRDTLEIAYENRFDQYDIQADRLPPLVPRALRLPVIERISARGEVLRELDEDSVLSHVPLLKEQKVESIAIGLIHAYANPDHETRISEILQAALPGVAISLSSQVCAEIREYERQSTTVANAYVRPNISAYLADMESQLTETGFKCPCLLMTSAGSLVTIETASKFPIRLVESGPAGGAILAAHIAKTRQENQLVSFDMGGTTAKICLIDDAEPLLSREFEIDRAHRFMKGSGTPVKIPVIEMVEIGAGGGSIARVDELNRIQVGPDSAGSEPGPACYGRGGTGATVTDANLILGRLDRDRFANGSITLSRQAAEQALEDSIGRALDLGALDAAKGLIEIVDENMASAARVHAAERGKDLAGRTMVAFGGAAPLHATRLADKLGIEKVIVPADAGVGSAIGFLLAPIAYEVVRSFYARLESLDFASINTLFATMEQEANDVVRLGMPEGPLDVRRHGYARYVGQGHEVKIDLPSGPLDDSSIKIIRAAFDAVYESHFGMLVPDMQIEILTWSVTVVAPRKPDAENDKSPATTQPETEPKAGEARVLHDPRSKDPEQASVIDRDQLQAGGEIAGAAIIAESQTSTIVPADWRVSLNEFGDLILVRSVSEALRSRESGLANDVRMQVLWDRLISIVEEQAQAIIRSAFSTTVREAGDLSAGIFDPGGRMLAQAVTGTPGHVNAMAASVGYFLEKYPPETMRPGDVYVTNDPWLGTGHLFDFTVVTPVFHEATIVALFASTVHVVDIGGIGFSPDSGQVFEEGLCIPIMPLFEEGVANKYLFDILRTNVREPVQVVGDLYSLASSNEIGARQLVDMMGESNLGTLDDLGNHIITTSETAMIEAISKLPRGQYTNSMTVDGYDKPIDIHATVDIGADSIVVDYSGTSPVSTYGINVPLTYAQAYTSFGLRCIIGSNIPNNSGSLRPIVTNAPVGCILNAPRPCAVNVRHVVGQMLPDVVLGCLGQALPGQVPAEGSSSLWNPMLSGGHGLVGDQSYGNATPFSITIFHSGGTGARPGKHGLSATAFPSGVRNTPVEITESISPIVYWRKEFRDQSGGEGEWRGGDGQIIEIEHGEGAPFALF